MTEAINILRNYPQIIIFAAVACGYFIGKIKIFGFNLGSTAGVLLVALVFGQLDISIPPLLEAIMFAFFIFCIGYKVGPEFFSGIKKEGIKYIILAFFVALVGLITAFILSKLLHLDPGTAAGLLGGAMTQSSIIGTAGEAIRHLGLDPTTTSLFTSNIAVAYAITYIFGTAGLVIFFKLVPRLIGIDLKAESHKLELEMSGNQDDDELSPEMFRWNRIPDLRIYSVTNAEICGKTALELGALFDTEIAIDSIKRDGKIFLPTPFEIIQANDLIAIVAKAGDFLRAEEIIGPEVYDKDLGALIGESLKICILNKEAVGKTLEEISTKHGYGCFFKKLYRQGHEIPITKNTIIKKCDELEVIGAKQDVETIIKYLGYPERSSFTTDLVLVGAGCALGSLLGLIAIHMEYIPITLGLGGGVLVAGLVFGWLRSLHPTFGSIPAGAQWLLTDLGLNLFIACVGLAAAPKALHALQSSGLSLFFAGIILTLLPMILGTIFGKYVLKIPPALLFGALTGAGTVTAALNALKEEADSSVPVLGYTVPFAFGNVLLTVWGTVIVYLIH